MDMESMARYSAVDSIFSEAKTNAKSNAFFYV